MSFRQLLFLLPLLSAVPARGAVLTYLSAQRFLQEGETFYQPSEEFAAMEEMWGGAFQASQFQAQTVTVRSEVQGGALLSLSAMKVTFHLAEATEWSAAGRFWLLGESGFACVSLSRSGGGELILVNEVAGDPPAASLDRAWSAAGVLEPGRYLLDAIIYTGGKGQPQQGRLTMQFHIPEPSAAALAAAALLFCQGRVRIREQRARG
jgi:hypothetical protein